jgi:phosphate starvation-inducible protein PhoH and related proteins
MKKNVTFGQGAEAIFGTLDENLRFLESAFEVRISLAENNLIIEGSDQRVEVIERLILDYNQVRREGVVFTNGDLKSIIKIISEDSSLRLRDCFPSVRGRICGRKTVTPRSLNQRRYLDSIEKYDMVFGIGPAGTGKTYLAVAMAVAAFSSKQVNRIVLARPAVEAGERLGFLPGSLQEKVDPYLRPLYDALYDMLDVEKVDRYIERGTIEIAPIAFMRGRTLNESFVILDEAQNTTSEQMKMFLTRIGFNSKAVITGDVTQIDLPSGRISGLVEARNIVSNVEGIDFVHFSEKDVVRHPLVQRIVRAYEIYGRSNRNPSPGASSGASENSASPPVSTVREPGGGEK